MVTACGLLTFGLAANLGGSGFLAIFLAGVTIGNSRFVFQRGTFLFHDGLAWLSQITMFVVLGLLIEPMALIFLARLLAVIPVLAPLGFNSREITLASWVRLRGSVPIILAIFPLIFGLPGAPLIFNVVFFVVLLSATIQGSTLPWVARRLVLAEPPPAAPCRPLPPPAAPCRARRDAGNHGPLRREYRHRPIHPEQGFARDRAEDFADGPARQRRDRHDHPQEHCHPSAGIDKPAGRGSLVRCTAPRNPSVHRSRFSQAVAPVPDGLPHVPLRLKGTTTVENVRNSYDIQLDADDNTTLDTILHQELGNEPAVDNSIVLNGITLQICEMVGRRIATVAILQTPPRAAADPLP